MYKRFALVLAVVLVLGMVLSACKPAEKLAKSINMNHATEPPTIDPGLSTDTTSVQCAFLMFMGLTRLDIKTVEPKSWLAKEYKVSADGLVWTFTLRNDIYWVQYDPATDKATKKRAVTAQDIEYGVKRVADPATASDYAYVDYIIKNAMAVNTGESTDLDSIGVKALNDTTLEFTLTQPAGYFPAIAGLWTNYPVPKEAVEQFGDKWTEPGNIWTCGAYMLASWEHQNKMVMKKNPYWFDAKNVSIEQINWTMVQESSTAFAMYENGELDVATDLLATDLDRAKADATLSKELTIAPVLCTYYLGFNTTKPPLDNVKVRQALSYGIDRQKLIDTVLKASQKPAKTFACPGIFGSPAEDASFKGIEFDPAKGKALLAEAGFPEGKGMPDITYMFNTSQGHQKIAEFVQQSWKENLGVEVKLANQEWAVYLKTVNTDAPQIYRMGWCADYADENNWVLENFHTTKSLNNPKWSGPNAEKFDQLTDEAASASDPAVRKQKYFEAERLLCVEDAVIAPVYYYTRATCTKPYVERTFSTQGGMEEIFYWKVQAH